MRGEDVGPHLGQVLLPAGGDPGLHDHAPGVLGEDVAELVGQGEALPCPQVGGREEDQAERVGLPRQAVHTLGKRGDGDVHAEAVLHRRDQLVRAQFRRRQQPQHPGRQPLALRRVPVRRRVHLGYGRQLRRAAQQFQHLVGGGEPRRDLLRPHGVGGGVTARTGRERGAQRLGAGQQPVHGRAARFRDQRQVERGEAAHAAQRLRQLVGREPDRPGERGLGHRRRVHHGAYAFDDKRVHAYRVRRALR